MIYDNYHTIMIFMIFIFIYYIYILKYRIKNMEFIIYTQNKRINHLTVLNKNLTIISDDNNQVHTF